MSQKCGFVALIGAPNAGKSTLTNTMVGQKVSIVTPKVQTTRTVVRGIVINDDTQLILVDTPGIFSPKQPLENAIVHAAWQGLAEADTIVLLIDAKKGLCHNTKLVIKALEDKKQTVTLALNKIDTVPAERLLPLAKECGELACVDHIFMISAQTGNGVDDLLKHLTSQIPEHPWMFPEDQISDAPSKLFAAEITREQLFMRLQQELPYSIAVDTESWEEKDKSITIHQTIYALKESHKSIILGKQGQTIKVVSQQSRKELTKAFGKKIHLYLFVKIKDKWTSNPSMYQMLGMEFNS